MVIAFINANTYATSMAQRQVAYKT